MEWMEQVYILGLGTMGHSSCDGFYFIYQVGVMGERGIKGKRVGVMDSWKSEENGED